VIGQDSFSNDHLTAAIGNTDARTIIASSSDSVRKRSAGQWQEQRRLLIQPHDHAASASTRSWAAMQCQTVQFGNGDGEIEQIAGDGDQHSCGNGAAQWANR
jgi:hypothetical protein